MRVQHNTLIAEGLSKIYGNKTVVKGIDISVKRGEIVGLLGPNGAGKTTSFYMITGMVKPSTGNVFLDNTKITHDAMYKRAKKGIGYLAQEPSIFGKLSVEDNLKLVLEMRKDLDRNKQKEKMDMLLNDLSVSHLNKSIGHTLSGGERRRVEIARCLCMDPDFILLDEPFAGVDPIAVEEIQGIIYSLKKKDIGVLITDHNVRETLGLIDRAVLIHEGSVLMEGTPDEIIQNEDVRRVYLGERFSI